jgi:hypothetical protein
MAAISVISILARRNQSWFKAFSARDDVSELWEALMRVLFGIILGVVLTVGVAFISDSLTTDPATTTGSNSATVAHRPMVNWDVVGDNMRIAQERVRAAWIKLSHKVTS